MGLVSVIIPTYNRFRYLQNTLRSIQKQTYKNLEIIVINDCSTDENYYQYDWTGIKIIHLIKNSRLICGYPCPGYVRNKGLELAKGDYIAFCDDDDIWFPKKIQQQLDAIERHNVKMSCSDGYIGEGVYDPTRVYKVTIRNFYLSKMIRKIKEKGIHSLKEDFPLIITKDFLNFHNCCSTSSIIIAKEIIDLTGEFKHLKQSEDYDYWLRALEHTCCIFIPDICFYIDIKHGDGKYYLSF